MNLGINVYRLSSLKHYAGLVEHALGTGIGVTLYCDHTERYTPRHGGKSYEFPDRERLPRFHHGTPTVAAYRSVQELADRLSADGVDVFFSLYAKPLLRELRARSRPALRLAQIQHGWDSFVHGADPELFDVVYGFSAGWPGWWAEYMVREGRLAPEDRDRALKQMEAVYVAAGFAEMEQLRYTDRPAARARLGLPAGRPVVAFFPFPFDSVARETWSHWVYGGGRVVQTLAVALTGRWDLWPYAARGWNDRRLVRAVRAFCDRHDAWLVTKSREKNRARGYLAAASDLVLYDEAYYPATIVDLVVAADLCIHFYSSVLSEAVCAGTPSLCVSPTAAEWPAYGRRMVVPEFSDAPGSFYHFPGVTWRLRVGELIERLPRATLGDFALDEAERRRFIERFLGPDAAGTAERIVGDLRTRFGLV